MYFKQTPQKKTVDIYHLTVIFLTNKNDHTAKTA